MIEVLASIVLFLLAVSMMAIGVLFGRASIRGSCGGPARRGVEWNCAGHCPRACARKAGRDRAPAGDGSGGGGARCAGHER